MNITKLRTFLMVVKKGSFTQAATELLLSPTGVLKHIESIETELSVSLFQRTHTGVTLTKDGVRFLEFANQVIALYNDLQRDFSKKTARQVIRVAVPIVQGQFNLSNLFQDFENAYPGVQMDVVEVHGTEFRDLLYNDRCDIAYCLDASLKADEAIIHRLKEDNWVLLVNQNHNLAQKNEFSIADLKNLDIVSPFKRMEDSSKPGEIFGQLGIKEKIKYDTNREDTLVNYIQIKNAAALVHISYVHNVLCRYCNFTDVKVLTPDKELQNLLGPIHFSVATPKDKNSPRDVKNLWNFTINYAKINFWKGPSERP